jgi:tetratricopeptide (TPR) repeat protein
MSNTPSSETKQADPAAELQTLAAVAEDHLRQGRRTEALAAYRRLVDADPARAEAWFNLAYLLRQSGEFEPALQAYAQALARGVPSPEEVHLNRAVILTDHLRRDDEAAAELAQALQLNPDYAPALLNLGNLHEERGEAALAAACYERLLALPAASRPGAPAYALAHEALARLPQLRAPQHTDDPLLNRLRQAAQDAPGLDPEVRANLLFALGRALDALGEHAEAFAAFARAHTAATRGRSVHNRATSQQLFDALIAAPLPPVDGRGPSTGRPAPLFICGPFRSGSTLVERVLGAHPQVTAGGEIDHLLRLASGPLRPYPQTLATLSSEHIAGLAQAYRDHLTRLFPDAGDRAYITDKRPDNVLLIGLIKRLFPAARIVHTVRHPMDIGLSIYTQHLNARLASYAHDLGDIGHFIGQSQRLITHWRQHFGDDIHDFDYDAFVRDPEPELRRLLDFLGLPWDEACLNFHAAPGLVKTASYWQVRRPLYRESSGRWRQYAPQLAPLRQALLNAGVAVPA